jgi:hypothetical protein
MHQLGAATDMTHNLVFFDLTRANTTAGAVPINKIKDLRDPCSAGAVDFMRLK